MHKVYICIVIVLAAVIRLIYAQEVQRIEIYPDSVNYYEVGKEILRKPTLPNIVNYIRTPIYPVFSAGIIRVASGSFPEIGSKQFIDASHVLIFIQSIIGIISIVVLYLSIIHIGLTPLSAFVFAVFSLCNVNIILWEHSFLTEGVSSSISVFILYAGVRMARKISPKTLALFVLLSAVCFLLRPNLVLIPICFFLPIMWVNRKNAIAFRLLGIAAILYVFLPIGYIALNYQIHQYAQIQNATDLNILGRIMQSDIPIEASRTNRLYTYLSEYRRNNNPRNYYAFVETYHLDYYKSPENLNELHAFIVPILRMNYRLYIAEAIKDMVTSFTEANRTLWNAKTIPGSVLYQLQLFYIRYKYISIIFLPVSLGFVIFYTFRPASIVNTLLMVLILSVFGQILSVSLVIYYFSWGSFDRYLVHIQHYISLFLYVFTVSVFLCIKNNVGKMKSRIVR